MSVDGCIASIAHPFKVVQTFLWFNILQPSDVGVVAVVVDYKEEVRTLLGQKVYVVDYFLFHTLSEAYLLQIVRYNNLSLEVLGSLLGVALSACRECLLLGMIQYEILYVEFGCKSACIKSCAVTFLVRLECVALGIQAERLAHHPVGMLYVGAVELIVWLVTKTRHNSSVWQLCTESILLLLGRMNIVCTTFITLSLP